MNKSMIGILCLIGYSIFTPISSNIRQYYSHIFPVVLIICAAAICSIIICYLILRKKAIRYFYTIKSWIKPFLVYTILDSIAWLCFFFIPAYWGAFYANYTYFSFQLLVGIVITGIKSGFRHKSTYMILVIVILQIIYFNYVYQYSNIKSFIFAASMVSGSGIIIYIVKTYLVKMVALGLDEAFILANRWWILFIATFVLQFHVNYDYHVLRQLVIPSILIAFSAMLIPLYLFMKSVVFLSPAINAVASGITPIITIFIQMKIFHQKLGISSNNALGLALCLAISTAVSYCVIMNQKMSYN